MSAEKPTDILIKRGFTFSIGLECLDAEGNADDLEGATAVLRIRKRATDTQLVGEYEGTITNNMIDFEITPDHTGRIPVEKCLKAERDNSKYAYDVMLTRDDDSTERLIWGVCEVQP